MNKHMTLSALLVALTFVCASNAFYKQTKVTLDTSDAQTQDLGVVNKQIAQTTSLPTSGKKIIEITPVEGTYYNQPIKVLLYAIEFKKSADTTQPLNIQAAAKKLFADAKIKNSAHTLVALYRQLPGEEQWTSLGEFPTVDSLKDLAQEDAIKLTVNGKAEIIAYLPAFSAAQKDGTAGSKVGAQIIKVIPQKGAPSILPGARDAQPNNNNASQAQETTNTPEIAHTTGSSDADGFVMD